MYRVIVKRGETKKFIYVEPKLRHITLVSTLDNATKFPDDALEEANYFLQKTRGWFDDGDFVISTIGEDILDEPVERIWTYGLNDEEKAKMLTL